MYVSGENSHNRLGIDIKEHGLDDMNEPALVSLVDDAALASSGIHNSYHSFMYTLSDRLYASGSNRFGQFGDGEQAQGKVIMAEIPRFWR